MMTISHTLNIVIYHNDIQYMTEIFCVVHAISYSKFAYCTTRTANAKHYPTSTHVHTNFHVQCAYVHSTHMCTILLDNQDEFQQNYAFYSQGLMLRSNSFMRSARKLLISQVYGICDMRLEFHKWQGEYMTMYLAY